MYSTGKFIHELPNHENKGFANFTEVKFTEVKSVTRKNTIFPT